MKTTTILFTSAALALVSCTPTQQQYGLGGAAAGGAISAIAGGDSSDIVKGLAVGGAAGVGYGAYRERQNQSYSSQPRYQENYQYQDQNPQPSSNSGYQTARPTNTPGVVISPYPPYGKVRVSNFRPGELAKDPTSGQIFVVPQQ